MPRRAWRNRRALKRAAAIYSFSEASNHRNPLAIVAP
jgi:hypothetical protein